MRFGRQCGSLLLLLSAREQVVGSVPVASSATDNAALPTPQACGTIVNDPDGSFIFEASLAYECLTSVPFNPAVAVRLIKYYNDTLEFQSTVELLKNPPMGYQQPSVDLRRGLQLIQDAAASSSFANQYEFEVALQRLIMAAHDSHLYLSAGILTAFTFASPFDIVSLSIDGLETPKVYILDDVVASNSFTLYQPPAIEFINDENVTSYLERFAANQSFGAIEPHTDWNQLMFSFAQDIQGQLNVFRGIAPFYFGDTMTLQFENGTSVTRSNLGVYWSQGPTGPLETGGDFYNFFVLGLFPASFDLTAESTVTPPVGNDTETTAPVETSLPAPTAVSWNSIAYPKIPDVAAPDLGPLGGGFVSGELTFNILMSFELLTIYSQPLGYFINSSSLAVLSIPSFDEFGTVLQTTQQTVNDFILRGKQAGLQKVVIDLQQNTGGQVLLAIDTFKRFFPGIEPFSGSQMRASNPSDVMGRTLTEYFDQLDTTDPDYPIFAVDEWVSSTRLNAQTGSNFTSWDEFFGPVTSENNVVTGTQRFNLSSTVFVENSIQDENFTLDSTTKGTSAPPWEAEDIIILTDGVCGSACALFVEMMHHEAGVRVVTVGGRPVPGPMQGVGNTRGARLMSTSILDNNIGVVQEILGSSPDANFLPNRTEALDVFVLDGGVNLRDQVRKGETIPLQFVYEAADCRIYYTPQTILNYTALWISAANAMAADPPLCVAGSTDTLPMNSTNSQSSRPGSFDPMTYIPNNENATALIDPGEITQDIAGDLTDQKNTRLQVSFIDCPVLNSAIHHESHPFPYVRTEV
ncbi:hypothetical protein F5Y01DRAFT_314578 [Xylaria sp. FL0043]|nr:hypothetical protein F5Y01DRAFT_314578 [Xylaria sp. FL0043]